MVLLWTNSNGSENQMTIITGKSAIPQCFINIKKILLAYYANSKAWIMLEIFMDCLCAVG